MAAASTERLLLRAETILEGRSHGFDEPILWHLALRRHSDAMLALADRVDPGRLADPFSAMGLLRRAYRLGSARAAQHLAMMGFNRGDLATYRQWLARGATLGDEEAAQERRRFELRLPHANARQSGRGRPYRVSDGRWTANRVASKPTRYYPPDRFRPRAKQ